MLRTWKEISICKITSRGTTESAAKLNETIGCWFRRQQNGLSNLYSTWSIVSKNVDMKTNVATSDDGTFKNSSFKLQDSYCSRIIGFFSYVQTVRIVPIKYFKALKMRHINSINVTKVKFGKYLFLVQSMLNAMQHCICLCQKIRHFFQEIAQSHQVKREQRKKTNSFLMFLS